MKEDSNTNSDGSTDYYLSLYSENESDYQLGEYVCPVLLFDNIQVNFIEGEEGFEENVIYSQGKGVIQAYVYVPDPTTGEPINFIAGMLEITGITLIG